MALAFYLEGERNSYADGVLERMASGAEAVVPSLWLFEVANALLMAERRRRLTEAQTAFFLEQLSTLPVSVDPPAARHIFEPALLEARRWNLTVYDAAYLELALRRGIPLATLDDALKKSAKSLGVPLLS